eukprot:scaffold134799_cov21-Tisochrysis_lutea.AAC.2
MPGYVLAYACKSRSTSVVPARVHACASMQGSLIKASCTSIMDTASKAKKCRLKSGNQVIRNMGCEKVSCARPACNNLVGLSVGYMSGCTSLAGLFAWGGGHSRSPAEFF